MNRGDTVVNRWTNDPLFCMSQSLSLPLSPSLSLPPCLPPPLLSTQMAVESHNTTRTRGAHSCALIRCRAFDAAGTLSAARSGRARRRSARCPPSQSSTSQSSPEHQPVRHRHRHTHRHTHTHRHPHPPTHRERERETVCVCVCERERERDLALHVNHRSRVSVPTEIATLS